VPRVPPPLIRLHQRLHQAGIFVPLVYSVVAAVLFGSTLNIFFMSDDFEFLKIVTAAKSPLVIFEPLVGRYIRPLVVLMYYVCYKAFGFAPWSYHVATLVPHVLSTWLVYLVARRLGGAGSDLWAFLAGLLFLAFSGHSEAVTWPAGVADPILTVCLLAALLCYLRALDPGRSPWWLAAMFASVAIGSLAKELWVVFPGILVAHAVTFGVWRDALTRRRAAVAIGGLTGLVGGYLLVRHVVFGSVTGGYSGLGLSIEAGIFAQQARAFVVRCFAPAMIWPAHAMSLRLDLVAWIAAAGFIAWGVRGRPARVLAFCALAMICSLAPVLPLTISIATTESERFVYLPTAFSCILLVWVCASTLRPWALAVIACLVAIAVHTIRLDVVNARWHASGTLTKNIVDSYADLVREHDPRGTTPVFLLNIPDNVSGAYVYRNGFVSALEMFHPDLTPVSRSPTVIASHSIGSADEEMRLDRLGERRLRLDLGPMNRFILPSLPQGVQYRIESQSPHGYQLQMGESTSAHLMLYYARGRLASAGLFEAQGTPFGAVDAPPDGASCTGASIQFHGWALDNREVARVVFERVDDGDPQAPASADLIGELPRAALPRPDVAKVFGTYPGADRAGWMFEVPCRHQSRDTAMRVRVTAHDREGNRAVIGERVIRIGR
jgi:hypothetical protein